MTDIDGLMCRLWIASSKQMQYLQTINRHVLALQQRNVMLPLPVVHFAGPNTPGSVPGTPVNDSPPTQGNGQPWMQVQAPSPPFYID